MVFRESPDLEHDNRQNIFDFFHFTANGYGGTGFGHNSRAKGIRMSRPGSRPRLPAPWAGPTFESRLLKPDRLMLELLLDKSCSAILIFSDLKSMHSEHKYYLNTILSLIISLVFGEIHPSIVISSFRLSIAMFVWLYTAA